MLRLFDYWVLQEQIVFLPLGQVVAFLASLEIAAEQFPGAFAGYNLEVLCFISFILNTYPLKETLELSK